MFGDRMNLQNNANLSFLIHALLDQDLTVAYLDNNPIRRNAIVDDLHFVLVSSPERLRVSSGEPSGYASLHYNVVIAVNSHEFSFPKEHVMIAGYVNEKLPMIMEISL
jgi:hypothetical protein